MEIASSDVTQRRNPVSEMAYPTLCARFRHHGRRINLQEGEGSDRHAQITLLVNVWVSTKIHLINSILLYCTSRLKLRAVSFQVKRVCLISSSPEDGITLSVNLVWCKIFLFFYLRRATLLNKTSWRSLHAEEIAN